MGKPHLNISGGAFEKSRQVHCILRNNVSGVPSQGANYASGFGLFSINFSLLRKRQQHKKIVYFAEDDSRGSGQSRLYIRFLHSVRGNLFFRH